MTAPNPNGQIRAFCEVHCRGCEAPYLGLPGLKWQAAAELTRNGWAKRKGRWYCPACPA